MPPKESHHKLSRNPIKLSLPGTSTEPNNRGRFNTHPYSATTTRKLSIPSSSKPLPNALPSKPRPPPPNNSIPCRPMQTPQPHKHKPLLKKLPKPSTVDPLPRPSRKSVTKVCNLRSGPPPSLPATPKKKTIELEKKPTHTLIAAATPPVNLCISPEIRQSALVPAMPFSHADEHLLAGVPDCRKCKPRGLLITGRSGMEVEGAPALREATIQWCSSPSKEVSPTTIARIRSAMWHEDYVVRSDVGNWSSDEDDDVMKVEAQPLAENAWNWSSDDDVYVLTAEGAEPLAVEVENWSSNYDDLLKVERAPPHTMDVQNCFATPSKPPSVRDAGNSLTRRALWHSNCLYTPHRFRLSDDNDGMVNYLDSSPQNFQMLDDDGMVKYLDSPPKDPHWDFPSPTAKSPSSGCVFLGTPSGDSHLSPFTAMIQRALAAKAGFQFGYIAENVVAKCGQSSPIPQMTTNKQQCLRVPLKRMIKPVSGPRLESARVKTRLTFGSGMNLETKKVEQNLCNNTSISPFLGIQHQVATMSRLVPLNSRQQNQFVLNDRCLSRCTKAEPHLRTMRNLVQHTIDMKLLPTAQRGILNV